MKTIGLIGGLSWVSSRDYYTILNTEYNQRKGNSHSCPVVMYSFDFGLMETLQKDGNWSRISEMMSEAAIKVEKGGADLVLICSNTMHFCLEAMQSRIMIPILHIAEAAGKEIVSKGIAKIGIMGTRYLMEMPFYRELLQAKYALEVIMPDEQEIEDIDQIIYLELTRGLVNKKSKRRILEIINRMTERGAQGTLLACTELPLIAAEIKTKIPLFNSTKIHAMFGLDFAMKEHLYA